MHSRYDGCYDSRSPMLGRTSNTVIIAALPKRGTMNDTRQTLGPNPHSPDGHGIVQAWIDGGVDTAEAVLRGSIDLLDQCRGQVTERVVQTIDWAEGFPRGVFAIARQLTRSVDTIAAQSIGAADRVGSSILHACRRAGHGARDFAADATSSLIGRREQERQASSVRVTA